MVTPLILIASVIFMARATLSATFLAALSANEYDPFVAPVKNGPTIVTIQLSIHKITAIDTRAQTYGCGVFVRQRWIDERLILKGNDSQPLFSRLVTIPTADQLWTPDLYFLDAIDCDLLNNLLEVNVTDGQVYRARAMWCTIADQFNLSQFPFDTQELRMRLVSFTLPSSDLILRWNDLPLDPLPEDNLSSSLWTFESSVTNTTTKTLRRNQEFIVAQAYVSVTRRTTQYFNKIILPLFVVVALSTGQFFVDLSSVPARVAFSITMTLTVITFNVFLSNELPRVGYSTLLDQWVLTALFVTAFGVTEFVLVSALRIPALTASYARTAFARRCSSLGAALEVFARVFATFAWLLITLLFFVERPGGLIAMVVLVTLWFVVACVVARRTYMRTMNVLREEEEKRILKETEAAKAAELAKQAVIPTVVLSNDSEKTRRRKAKRDKAEQ